MIKAKNLIPITIIDKEIGFKDGYKYNNIFIPKGFGAMNDSFINRNFKGWNIIREIPRKAKVMVKFINKDTITGDWYEIVEE